MEVGKPTLQAVFFIQKQLVSCPLSLKSSHYVLMIRSIDCTMPSRSSWWKCSKVIDMCLMTNKNSMRLWTTRVNMPIVAHLPTVDYVAASVSAKWCLMLLTRSFKCPTNRKKVAILMG
uniref:Uncharacterized protein n=1 Tax=Helianthus annuus TaxID=4232 RepID=A0A251VQV6_HELAN